jgi:hypothetical protein
MRHRDTHGRRKQNNLRPPHEPPPLVTLGGSDHAKVCRDQRRNEPNKAHEHNKAKEGRKSYSIVNLLATLECPL